MAYTLQAIVMLADERPIPLPSPLCSVSIGANVKLVPLASGIARELGIPVLPFAGDGETETPSKIRALCEELSQGRKLAYIEAELFAGSGSQACILFTDGKQIGQPVISGTAINHALQRIGVSRGAARDEFEAVGLGAHRDSDAWLR